MADSSVMVRRPALFWAVLGLLGMVYAGLVMRQRIGDKREQRLVPMRARDVTGFRLAGGDGTEKTGGSKFDLKREGDGFVFLDPYPGVVADGRAVNNYLSVLERVSVRRRWKHTGDLSLFGIRPDSPRLTIDLGKGSFVLAVGKKNPVGPDLFVYVEKTQTDASGEIALLPLAGGALFQTDAVDFRGRRLLPDNAVQSWTMQREGGPPLKAELRDNEWLVSEGAGSVVPSDRFVAGEAAQRIARLLLTDFEAIDRGLSLAQAGLLKPFATLTVWGSSAPSTVLTLGRADNPRVLNVAVNGQVRGGVPADFLDSWPSLAQLRKHSLVDFPLAAVTRFAVERDESLAVYEKQRGKWYRLGRERRLVDPRGVQTFLLALAKVKIDSFDFSGSVDSPQRRYVFYNSEGERLMELRLGENTNGAVAASLGQGKFRFSLSASETDQWGF